MWVPPTQLPRSFSRSRLSPSHKGCRACASNNAMQHTARKTTYSNRKFGIIDFNNLNLIPIFDWPL